jgi:putative ABC transport system ATP-binding protein
VTGAVAVDQPAAGDPRGGPPVVRCVDVSRTYGAGPAAVVAVHGTSCEVSPGARVALTGPSGSGKSTLLHLLAGLDRPSAGRVSWPGLGEPARPGPGQVGLVFQGPSLLPALDAVENAALPLVLAGRRQDDAEHVARTALALVGAGSWAGRLPEELSGGQAQRVAVARAVAGQPVLILADEPTAQLDRAAAEALIDVLLAVTHRLGAALVLATHDPAVANRLDQHWQLTDGRLHSASAAGTAGAGGAAEGGGADRAARGGAAGRQGWAR